MDNTGSISVGLYIRVSTEDQSREGHSIPAQKERLLAFCRAQGWDVGDIYSDEGISGAKLDRPELARLRKDAAEKRINMVLVWKVDRLSRKVSHLASLVEEFDRSGCALRSVTEPFRYKSRRRPGIHADALRVRRTRTRDHSGTH